MRPSIKTLVSSSFADRVRSRWDRVNRCNGSRFIEWDLVMPNSRPQKPPNKGTRDPRKVATPREKYRGKGRRLLVSMPSDPPTPKPRQPPAMDDSFARLILISSKMPKLARTMPRRKERGRERSKGWMQVAMAATRATKLMRKRNLLPIERLTPLCPTRDYTSPHSLYSNVSPLQCRKLHHGIGLYWMGNRNHKLIPRD